MSNLHPTPHPSPGPNRGKRRKGKIGDELKIRCQYPSLAWAVNGLKNSFIWDRIVTTPVEQTAWCMKFSDLGDALQLMEDELATADEWDQDGIIFRQMWRRRWLHWTQLWSHLLEREWVWGSVCKWFRPLNGTQWSCATNKGVSTCCFNVTRGIRQGDPASTNFWSFRSE